MANNLRLIAAGNKREAIHYIERNLGTGEEWRYVDCIDIVRGVCRGSEFHIVGNFWKRGDAPEIYELAVAYQLQIIRTEESRS